MYYVLLQRWIHNNKEGRQEGLKVQRQAEKGKEKEKKKPGLPRVKTDPYRIALKNYTGKGPIRIYD